MNDCESSTKTLITAPILIFSIVTRSPRSPLMLRGSFPPNMRARPPQFSPNSPIRMRGGVMMPGLIRPGYFGPRPRPRMWAAAHAARFAVMRHRMPTIASVDQPGI